MSQSVPNLRTSERRDAKRCWQRWWWAWREGLRPIGQPSNPLWFGTGWHLALAEWYKPGWKRGIDPRETWTKYVDGEIRFIKTEARQSELDLTEQQVGEYVEAKQLGLVMFDNYLDTYGNDDHWKIIAREQTFQMLINDPEDVNFLLCEYDGTFDGVAWDAELEEFILLEHKTAKAISTSHLSLDDQAGSYWAIATQTLRHQNLLKRNEKISGIMYNFARKGLPDDRPKNELGQSLNKNGSVSKMQPAPLLVRKFIGRTRREQEVQINRIQDEALHMAAVRSGELPITKNPTRDCSWDCSFFEMCELQESTPDWEDYKRAMFKVEDPYRDHRKSA